MASVANSASKKSPENKINDRSSNSSSNDTNEQKNNSDDMIPPSITPETEEEKRLRKVKERNLLRSQIYYGELGKLTAAEEAQKRAKEKLAKAADSAKKFLKVFQKFFCSTR